VALTWHSKNTTIAETFYYSLFKLILCCTMLHNAVYITNYEFYLAGIQKFPFSDQ